MLQEEGRKAIGAIRFFKSHVLFPSSLVSLSLYSILAYVNKTIGNEHLLLPVADHVMSEPEEADVDLDVACVCCFYFDYIVTQC